MSAMYTPNIGHRFFKQTHSVDIYQHENLKIEKYLFGAVYNDVYCQYYHSRVLVKNIINLKLAITVRSCFKHGNKGNSTEQQKHYVRLSSLKSRNKILSNQSD